MVQLKKWLGSYAHSSFIVGRASTWRAVKRLIDCFVLWCRSWNWDSDSQFLHSWVVRASADALCIVCVGRQSHDCAGSNSIICRCGRWSLVISGLRCKAAAGYETTSAWTQITSSLHSSRKIFHAEACALVRVMLVLCVRRHVHYCASRFKLVSMRTSYRIERYSLNYFGRSIVLGHGQLFSVITGNRANALWISVVYKALTEKQLFNVSHVASVLVGCSARLFSDCRAKALRRLFNIIADSRAGALKL